MCQWVEILEFEGLYEVSDTGLVRSKRRIVTNGKLNGNLTINEKLLKMDLSAAYPRVTLSKEGKTYRFSVHRLVAQAFIPNPDNKPMVNHKNGNKLDACVENLEWVTASENCKHALDTQLATPVKGENHGCAILTEKQVLEMRQLYDETEMTHQQIANLFGVDRRSASEVISSVSWKHLPPSKNKSRKMPLGKDHHNSLINEETARKVKCLLLQGQKPKQISEELGISRDIVYDIKRQKTWKHVIPYHVQNSME